MIDAAMGTDALCAVHAERAATATCERCGTFLCDACIASRDPVWCEPCLALEGDQLGLTTTSFSFSASFSLGIQAWLKAAGGILPICAVLSLPVTALNLVLPAEVAPLAVLVVSIFTTLICDLSTISLMLAAARGRSLTAGQAVSQAFSEFGGVFGARFLAGLWVTLFTLLLCIPGMMQAAALAVVTPAAFLEPDGDALERSRSLTEGRRWEVFGVIALAFVGMMVLQALTGFVTTFARILVPHLRIPGQLILGLVQTLGGSLLAAVTLATYFGLRRLKDQ